nr:LysR substrate-binding domain-containing protein [uncultured Ruegeria sp.]
MSGLSLRQIRCFLATCQSGTVAEAARALSITQPAASRRIAQMEDLLGLKLFDRVGRRMVPTQPALRLVDAAELALSGLAGGIAAAKGIDIPVLRIGALPTVAGGLVTKAVLRFRTERPDTMIRIETGMGVALLERLRNGQLDLVVGRMAGADMLQGLAFEPLYQDRLGAFVRPGHPLTAGVSDPTMFTDFPLILPPPDAVVRATVDTFLAARGYSPARDWLECADPNVAVALLAATDAVWLISYGAGEASVAKGVLTALNLKADDTIGQIGLTTRAKERQSPYLVAMCDMLRHEA